MKNRGCFGEFSKIFFGRAKCEIVCKIFNSSIANFTFSRFSDVVFVEDVRSIPVGRVLKVDGQYAAVRFPPANGTEIKDEQDWQDCRLMKKDDLQV